MRLSKDDRDRNRRQAAEEKARRERHHDEMGFTGRCAGCGARTLPEIAAAWPDGLCPDCREGARQ